MKISEINQGINCFLHDTKTVEWLIENTTVSVFDPIKFNGYQREISENHCRKIVKYLEKEFYLPIPIICACDEKYNDNVSLRIVDGQHRVHAFRNIKKFNPSRYNEIKNFEISVIVMEEVNIDLEIDTFITINKTSKKVDTSLAYVLKNKLNVDKQSRNLTISKLDFLAVELAVELNDNNFLWKNKISFTGSPNNKDYETISLNAFVKATRRLIGQLDRKKIINIEWQNKEEIDSCLAYIAKTLGCLWFGVVEKWPNLFAKEYGQSKIIQGPIGYSAITRFIANQINNLTPTEINEIISSDSLNSRISKWINSLSLQEDVWYSGNRFSRFTSESGYNIIVSELKGSMNY